jgi:hypothetical protein
MMNQGPDAITAAAAIAVRVLMAPHPVVAYTLTHTQDPTTASSYVPLSSIASVVGHLNPSSPRPEQGGQRITL